jgi:hypothetical protein
MPRAIALDLDLEYSQSLSGKFDALCPLLL